MRVICRSYCRRTALMKSSYCRRSENCIVSGEVRGVGAKERALERSEMSASVSV